MHESRTTIGVLTPFTGGFYYGAILAGIHATARQRGVATVAIHTTGLDLFWPEEVGGRPLALDAIDGWIAVNEFDSFHYTSRIVASGKPLVYLSERRIGLPCCSVLPDNAGGAKAATRHLIEHGHRRIAFAGFLGQLDLRERYDGYLQAHHEAGLLPDPSLLFWTANNLELDGREVGRQLVAADLPCTAVVTGTDKLALGLMEFVSQAGHQVPDELAVIGFDDIEKAQYSVPPLSTVRQRFDLLAGRAAEVLIAHLVDGAALPNTVRVPTTFVTRESCGCSTSASLTMPAVSETREKPTEALRLALCDAIGGESEEMRAKVALGAARIAERLYAVASGAKPYVARDFAGLWRGFFEGAQGVETIEELIATLEAFARAWQAELAPDRQVQLALRQLRLDLMRSWRVAEQVRSRYYDFVAEANGKINVALAGSDFETAKGLSWLRWTRISYGMLGLWSKASENKPRTLQVISEYGAGRAPASLLGGSYPPAQFPPDTAHDLVQHLGGENMLMLVPVTGTNGNRGVMMVAGPVEVELLDHVGSIHDWGALVGAALEREDVEEQLRDHALRDSLTGMPNRSLLMQRLERILETTRTAFGERFAVLFLDLDDFKNINDSLGHLAGDELLVQIAHRLQASLRDTDTIARLGGDEFAVLVPNIVHERDLVDVVARIQGALSAPFSLRGDPVFTSCSIGVVFNSERHKTAADLLRDADTAMYRSKLQGRGRYEVFDSGMHAQALEKLRLDSRLRSALERGEFELHYQPLISLSSGRPVGAEALIRWNHPEQGCLSPGRFLSVAEEVGLAIPISRWVLQTAAAEVARWREQWSQPLYVNINVPAQHFKDPGFVELLQQTLERHGLPPAALGIELVESSLIEHQRATIERLEWLRRLGIRTAIDDFGTGYSSLSYLKSFPLSVLKLDRSFIKGAPSDPHDTAIVRAIIAMAHGLDLTVVAEGVERVEQADFLRAEGCDIVQGFLLSQPLPARAVRDYFDCHVQNDVAVRQIA